MIRHPRLAFALALAGMFAFRVFYGLSMPFWYEDERQVYLIGLKSFARGDWPFYGADIVWTGGQLPGALLGWLIRLPLEVWPAPESPVIFLNLLSFATLSFFAWYLTRRLPDVPRWLIWSSLFTLPWTLNFSTHIINPSYLSVGAVIFFVGFFEGTPLLTRRIIPSWIAWAMMGAGLLSAMQLHMSWVLLVPFIIAACASLAFTPPAAPGVSRPVAFTRAVAAFAGGAAIPGSLLIRTITLLGWSAGNVDSAVVFHWQNPLEIVTTAARVLSFASFEVNRFIGMSTAERWLAMMRHPLIAVTVIPVALAGLVHPIWMAVTAFRPAVAGGPDERRDWVYVRLLLLGTVVLITGSYYFSIRGPQAHAFYVVFPVSVLFAFTCWNARARARGGRLRGLERVAIVVIGAHVLMCIALAIDRLPRQSLYANRDLVTAAIADRDDRYLGDRRHSAVIRQIKDLENRPVEDSNEASYTAIATNDLQVTAARWTPVAGRFSAFDVTVMNRSIGAAWLDLRLTATYKDAAGATVAAREVAIKQILQPGESRHWTDVADGWIPDGATDATIEITSAEKAVPRRQDR